MSGLSKVAADNDRRTLTAHHDKWILSRDEEAWFEIIPGEDVRIRVNSRDVGGRYAILESVA